MSPDDEKSAKPAASRAQRLADELRANLRKRKAAGRERPDPKPAAPKSDPEDT